MAAVHREGLGYPGPDTSSQPWSRALHLPRVYHILHRHPEWASCKEKAISPSHLLGGSLTLKTGERGAPGEQGGEQAFPAFEMLGEARANCANTSELAKKM